jgi:hypothetical protein
MMSVGYEILDLAELWVLDENSWFRVEWSRKIKYIKFYAKKPMNNKRKKI